MAINPATIQAAASAIGAIKGIFGGSGKSAAQRHAESLNAQDEALRAKYLKQFGVYDAATEDKAMLDDVYARGGRALEMSNRSAKGAAIKGGTAPGDTGYAVAQQRRADDILNALSQEAVRLKSTEASRNMAYHANLLNAFGPAAGIRNTQSIGGMSQPVDHSGDYAALIYGVNGLFGQKPAPQAQSSGAWHTPMMTPEQERARKAAQSMGWLGGL